jgi:hypothetical protein
LESLSAIALVAKLRGVDPEMADFAERKLRESDPDGVVEKPRKLG